MKYLTEEGNDDYSGVSRESGREIVTKPSMSNGITTPLELTMYSPVLLHVNRHTQHQITLMVSFPMRVCLRKMISAQNLFHKKPKKNLELHRSMLKTQELDCS